MAGRILVIRGGAVGDFVLTLPALGLLRDSFPEAQIEVLGYRHIASLADGRYYANATRSIEYGPLAGFFSNKSELDPGLVAYFRSFNQIISYLYDPDLVFQKNLARCGVKDLIAGPAKILDGLHAALQLAKPLERMALFLDDPAARIHPSEEDLRAADALLPPSGRVRLALHPGSGSPSKNWPVARWLDLCGQLLIEREDLELVILGGESDSGVLEVLRDSFRRRERVLFPGTQPLPVTGALLQHIGHMVGHDSGIGHLAAAASCRCLLIFGPTDPELWAPQNPGVRILQAPGNDLGQLEVEPVLAAIREQILP